MSRGVGMESFGIGEIARKVGIATSAIRYYESIGLLPPSQRISGKRRYDESILEKLKVIQLAQQVGFSIAEIQNLLHDFPVDTPPSERWQSLAGKKLQEVDELIQRAQLMKAMLEQTLQCECATMEDCATSKASPLNAMDIQVGC
jgi:MerR family transcriptional regulator, redox-sensitive transcriptional activator SoxR